MLPSILIFAIERCSSSSAVSSLSFLSKTKHDDKNDNTLQKNKTCSVNIMNATQETRLPYFQHFWRGSQTHLEVLKSEAAWKSENMKPNMWLTDNFSSLEIMFVQMLRMNHLTVFCFCVVWLSFEGSSKFGASCAKRWHSWAYNWLYLGSSRALSTILRHKHTQWMTDHFSTIQYITMLIIRTYQQYDSFQDKFCIHTHVEKLQA